MQKNKKNNKQVYIILGPNGAGKTTSAKYLRQNFLILTNLLMLIKLRTTYSVVTGGLYFLTMTLKGAILEA